MKKSLFLAALATIALVSCTQNESIVERQEIGFSPLQYKAVNSKAIIEGNKYPSDLSFGLYAYHNSGSETKIYINGDDGKGAVCSYDATEKTFVSNPVAYWPLSGTLGMVAWSPSSIVASYTLAEKKLSIPFVAAGKETDPVDLMYSTPRTGLTKDSQNVGYATDEEGVADGGNGVGITFNHALSQIVVKAKVADTYTGATFKINSISLQDMNDDATLTVTESAVASWSETSNDEAEFNILSSVTGALSTTATEVGTPVLVIPQALVDQQQKLVISYSMTYNNVTTSTSKDVYLNSGTNDALTALAMGKKYTLNLTLYADRILYSPSVAEWYPGEDAADKDDYKEDYDVPDQQP
mgnify:CR=1 FL=1